MAQIKRIKNGKWQIRIQRMTNGVRKSVSETVSGSRKDAEDVLKSLLSEIKRAEKNPPPKDGSKTFNQLFDDYLSVIRPTVREQTFHFYENLIRRYLRKPFGKQPVESLTLYEVEKFYTELQTDLSAETIYKIHTQFKAAYKKARQWKWVADNPFEFAKPPKRTKSKKVILTVDELNRFLSACDSFKSRALWTFFILTGARSQEVLAARWKDIKGGVWHLSQVRIETPKVKKFDRPKTEGSAREVPLSPALLETLEKLKVEQNIQRIAAGDEWNDFDLIFCTGLGNPLRLSNLGEKCAEIAEMAGITKKVHPHLLRHSFITNLIQSGADVKTVAELVGHVTTKTTLDIYTHTDMENKQRAVETFSVLIH
jgi:integrase